MTPDLAAFVSARLDERQALAGEPRTWKVTHHECGQWGPCDEPCGDAAQCAAGQCWHKVIEGSDGMIIYDEGGHSEAEAAFLAASDPAWALRDIAAKRQIVTRWEFAVRQVAVHAVNGDAAESLAWDKIAGGLELDVLALASIDDGHPDYDPGWAAG